MKNPLNTLIYMGATLVLLFVVIPSILREDDCERLYDTYDCTVVYVPKHVKKIVLENMKEYIPNAQDFDS